MLESVNVPTGFFSEFLRGLIDGDGCLRKWDDPKSNRSQWYLKISAGSQNFLSWLNQKIESHFKSHGYIYSERNKYGNCCYLKISKLEYLNRLLEACYGSGVNLCLARKQQKALQFLQARVEK